MQQGFPRSESDIDIPGVLAERRRLAELRSDHKDMTQKIDQNLQLLHSARLSPKRQTAKESGNSNSQGMVNIGLGTSAFSNHFNSDSTIIAMEVDVTVSRPFAMVDEITEESPAAEDGLQLGDLIVKFGNVESGDNVLPRLASEGQANQGHPVPVVLMRQGTQINLTVTPRAWQGRGLLGCHFRIL